MRIKIRIILVFFLVVFTNSLFAQSILSSKIENFNMKSFDMPSGFSLLRMRITKPGSSLNEQIYQHWEQEKNNGKSEFKLLKEEKYKTNKPFNAFLFQKWNQKNAIGKNNIIEIEITICTSKEEIENTINYYTKDAYAIEFTLTPISYAGEMSWIYNTLNVSNNCYTLLFCKNNVFVRLFVKINNIDKNELEKTIIKIAKRIESKIDYSINN